MADYIPNKEPSEKKNCEDKDLPVQKLIHQKKNDYCITLKGLLGDLRKLEVTQMGLEVNYEQRKCFFVKTEKNYRITRNLELSVGVELIQASKEIKTNVAEYVKQNDKLSAALKDLTKSIKDVKIKFGDLRDAAFKLDASSKDSCNSSQMTILGCKKSEDCKEPAEPNNNKLPEACKNACKLLHELINTPKGFSKDIDVILNSAAEIVGIQSFSNIQSLENFQQDFETNASAFDALVVAKMTAGSEVLKTAQQDLTTVITDLTKSNYAIYNKRSEVRKVDKTKDYLCHHECKCIDCGCEGEHQNGFQKCKCEICEICTEVQQCYTENDNCEEKRVTQMENH